MILGFHPSIDCFLLLMLIGCLQEDLLYMKITNALHHHSIRRGIEVLRKHNFNLSALKRRPSLSSDSQANNTSAPTQDPTLWTNHRVMEWLRSIDLSEYAANMRGSGVHGALIVSIGCNKLIK